jgi:hypothetical protein
VKVRIEGLPGEVAALAGLLRGVIEVVEESRDYLNRGASRLVRRYLEVRAGEPPADDAPRRPACVTRTRRVD